MLLPRALAVSFLADFRIRIELEDDVFGEVDLTEALKVSGFAALHDPAAFTAALIDAKGVVTWAMGLALDPSKLLVRLKLQQFTIGTEFTMSDNRWRCTDTGTRAVIAIKLEHDGDPSWYAGPPYAVVERVIDEYDLEACELTPEYLTQARERMLSSRLNPCACSGLGLLRPRSEIREPLWMSMSPEGAARIGRGDLLLDRRVLDELAADQSVVADVLEKGRRSLSRTNVMRLHALFDALEAAHESGKVDMQARRQQLPEALALVAELASETSLDESELVKPQKD